MLEDHVLNSSMDVMKIKYIPWVLASRSSIWREEYDMIKKKKWSWSSCVELSNDPCSSLCDKPWRIKILRVDIKRRIQDMALSRHHDRLMSWAMIDQDLEHVIKWRVLYVSQDILIEHEKIQGWPRWREKIGSNIGQHMKHKECTTWDLVVW